MSVTADAETLRAALGVERWVADVAGDYPDRDALLAHAAQAATPLSPAEIDEAIAHHPRIGEKPQGESAAAAFSRSEQAGLEATGAGDAERQADEESARAIAAGNLEYEARFGRVFIIRAAGRSKPEIAEELQRRLKLDEETELAIVGEQLRDIALLRLEKSYP